MKEWKDDKALFALIKEELYTAVVGDIMDKMGYTRQFLPPRIRPLRDDMLVAGRAMTVLEADVLAILFLIRQDPVMQELLMEEQRQRFNNRSRTKKKKSGVISWI